MSLESIDEVSPLGRYVLLGVVAHARTGSVPVQSYEVRDFCTDHLAELPGDPFEGGLSRESVIRALSTLEGRGLVTSEVVDGSPVGKGRPAYRPAVEPSAVVDALADDDLLGPVAESLRE